MLILIKFDKSIDNIRSYIMDAGSGHGISNVFTKDKK